MRQFKEKRNFPIAVVSNPVISLTGIHEYTYPIGNSFSAKDMRFLATFGTSVVVWYLPKRRPLKFSVPESQTRLLLGHVLLPRAKKKRMSLGGFPVENFLYR